MDAERYYHGGQSVIRNWMDDHCNDPDYVEAVQVLGARIYNDLQSALAEEQPDELWIARCHGELSCLD